MTTPAVFLLLVLCAAGASPQGPKSATSDGLVHLHEGGTPVENGKTLDMDFDEVERKGSRSTVHVTFRSGGSVSGPMFELEGACAIAKSRHAHYFRYFRDPDEAGGDDWNYVIGYADALDGAGLELPPGQHGRTVAEAADDGTDGDANVVWSRDDCRLLGFPH